MNIEVLICTIGSGVSRVLSVMAEPRSDVSYLVSFQYVDKSEMEQIPVALKKRSDVRIVPVEGVGLSANRNNALNNARGDILLFADDDNRYSHGDFDRLIYAFGECPDVDALCLRSSDYDGKLHRQYPAKAFNLGNSPHGYYVRSCELALRNNKPFPKFDVRFGLGSEYLACGEEEIFVHDMLRIGRNVWYYPMVIVRTENNTTGERFNESAAVRRSKGAVLAAIHGRYGAALRVLKYAIQNVHGMSKITALHDMFQGVAYAVKIKRC